MIIMPIVTMPTKVNSSLFLTTFLIMTIEGIDKAVTAIINDNTVPIPTPF